MQSVLMLRGGDEFGRTQGGNNNGWCQDSEISWFDWSLVENNADLLAFSRMLIALRRAHAVFRRRQFLYGKETEGSGLPDAAWFRADGERMRDEDWGGSLPVVGVFLNGEEIASPDSRGRQVLDESFLLLFNGHHEDCSFTAPDGEFGSAWTIVFDTSRPDLDVAREDVPAGDEFDLVHHSMVLLRRVSE